MQHAAFRAQDRLIGHRLGHHVVECVIFARAGAGFVQELGRLQGLQRLLQLRFRQAADPAQHVRPHALADHRRIQQQPPRPGCQPVQPARDDRLDRGGDADLLRRDRQHARRLRHHLPAFPERAGDLFHEQRRALRPLHHPAAQRLQFRPGAHQRAQQRLGLFRIQRSEAEFGAIGAAGPVRARLRTRGGDQQQAGGTGGRDQRLQQRPARLVRPVQVLHQHDPRHVRAAAQDRPAARIQQALTADGRVEHLPGRRVHQRQIQQRAASRLVHVPTVTDGDRLTEPAVQRGQTIPRQRADPGPHQLRRHMERRLRRMGRRGGAQHLHALGRRPLQELVHQPRLAQPGIRHHRHRLRPPQARPHHGR